MSNEATIGFDCSQSSVRDWLQLVSPSSLCSQRSASIKEAMWVPFLKVPKTFRARKAICETTNRLFLKADLLTRFKVTKK